jgi:hypothetical protein
MTNELRRGEGNRMKASTKKQVEAATKLVRDYCVTRGATPAEAYRALMPTLGANLGNDRLQVLKHISDQLKERR